MSFEWCIFLALWVWALISILRVSARTSVRAAGLIALGAVALLVAARDWWGKSTQSAKAHSRLAEALPREGRPGGYVTSDQCRSCHPSQYDSWHRTYHRTMTQWAKPGAVVGNFSGVTLPWQGKACQLDRTNDEFLAQMPVELARPAARPGSFTEDSIQEQIGMVTGSHHMQVYWVPTRRGNLQSVFPYAYLIADQRWVPFVDTFLRDPVLPPAAQSWNRNCIKCHSVAGQPRANFQTAQTDTQVGELGIACEACHGPAEEHVAANLNPVHRYRQHLTHQPEPNIINPKRLSAKLSSQVCGQCHSIKWVPNEHDLNDNGYRYRPGEDMDRTVAVVRPAKLELHPGLRRALANEPHFLQEHFWSDGIARVSGRDYNGMIESRCYQGGNLSCISCHRMHDSNPVNQLGRGMESNEACFQCHQRYRSNIQAHTHHPPASTGSLCFNCHMPYTTYGLLKAIRNHYIDSPNARISSTVGRPNACNLCHLDKTAQWTANYLHEWYAQPALELTGDNRDISAAVLLALRGEAGQRALIAWSMGWKPAQDVSGSAWLVPYLAQLLEDPYSAVRYIAQRSLKQIPGFAAISYDFVGPKEQQTLAAKQVMEQWARSYSSSPAKIGPQILLEPGGVLQSPLFQRLLLSRDDRTMNLQE